MTGSRDMMMSELSGKEVVDLSEGVRFGPVRDADLILRADGAIEALVLPMRRGLLSGRREIVVPWTSVVKVGVDVVIVDLRAPSATGIPAALPERLGPARAARSSGKESVSGGNGHWRL